MQGLEQGSEQRNQRGAGVIGMCIALLLILMVLSFFAFDASRIQMAQRQLASLADAAALAGTSMLASYDVSDDPNPGAAGSSLAIAQLNGIAYARNMVQAGNVLGQALNSNSASLFSNYTSFSRPTLGQCNIYVELINPQTGLAVSAPDPSGRAYRVSLAYGYRPVFWPVISGNVTIPLIVKSVAALPQVDTVMVFDFSGSMDDLTVVSIVDRYWDNGSIYAAAHAGFIASTSAAPLNVPANQQVMVYKVLTPHTPAVVSNAPAACLANYVGWDFVNHPNGIETNVVPPQHLEALGTSGNPQPGTSVPFVYDFYTRRYYNTADYGTPPGNCYLTYNDATVGVGNSWTKNASANAFTDIVVNIANPGTPGSGTSPGFPQPLYGPFPYATATINFTTWGSYQVSYPTGSPPSYQSLYFEPDSTLRANTFHFPNLPSLVEAARGNLEGGLFQPTYANGANTPVADRTGYTTATAKWQVINADGTVTNGTGGFTAQAGTQKAYQRLAMLYSQPIATAIDGAYAGYFQKLQSLADSLYGFVGFSDSTAFTSGAPYNVDGHLKSGIDGFDRESPTPRANAYRSNFPTDNIGYYNYGVAVTQQTVTVGQPKTDPVKMPRIPLNYNQNQLQSFLAATGTNMYTTSTVGAVWDVATTSATSIQQNSNGLFQGTATAWTDAGEALQTAVASFQSPYYNYTSATPVDRRASRRAVVFFTDGIPSDQSTGTAPVGDALTAANLAHTEGITFFDIGLALNSALTTPQAAYLDENTGICSVVGNGSKFFPVTQSSDVKAAFSAVVRRLTQGQRSQ